MKCTSNFVVCLAGLFFLMNGSAATGGPGPAALILEIDGKGFTAVDIQRKNPGATFQARNALYEAERKATDEFVSNYLLEREAKKTGLAIDQLLERDAYANLPKDPSEEALRVYYDGIDTPESFEAVRDKIRDLVKERRKAKAKTAYIQALRARSSITMRLAAPRAPIETGDAPLRGVAGAPVTIIEYADYECPYCQQIRPAVEKLQNDYKGKIAFVFKDVPLPMHANAQKAAEAAHCAGTQGKFWEYHSRLFDTKQFAVASLKDHARALRLDQASFDKCLDSGAQAERIKAYVAEAQSIALPGTPGFFINGRFLNGAIDYEAMRQVIEEELRAVASSGVEARNGQ